MFYEGDSFCIKGEVIRCPIVDPHLSLDKLSRSCEDIFRDSVPRISKQCISIKGAKSKRIKGDDKKGLPNSLPFDRK